MHIKTYSTTLIAILLFALNSFGQTSWTGESSTRWKDSDNWTSGVPTTTSDIIIGDANFTGANQPEIKGKAVQCNSFTIGDGAVVSTLTLKANLTVAQDLVIGANGTIDHAQNNRSINLAGNWSNSGTFTFSASGVQVIFQGTAQSIIGATTFNDVIISSSSTTTLNSNITINGEMQVDGIFNPTASYAVGGTGDLIVNSGGYLKVMTENFSTNYTISGTISLNENSYVDYASADITQNISAALTYCNLKISGGTTKYLTANLPPLYSSNGYGMIYIEDGTLDMQTYTADRGAAVGGFFTIASGGVLKIGGTNGFPANYNNLNLATGSTVYYYGNNQTVLNTTYGNLTFQSTSGDVVKTMPTTLFDVLGTFTCEAGSGSSVTFTAGSEINFYGNFILDATSTFNADSYIINFSSDILNSGTINGNTSTFHFEGSNCTIAGSGTYTLNNVISYATGTTATDTTNLEITGDLVVDGGSFTHSNGGTLTMSGTTKQILGTPVVLSDLSVTGSITGNGNIEITGNLAVDGTYESATSSFVNMSGLLKTISGTGDITFYDLDISGDVSTNRDFTIENYFNIQTDGAFEATSGTVYVDGDAAFSGNANLYNLEILATKNLALTSSSNVGIANALTATGTFDASSYSPNTVDYNGAGAQDITNVTYSNLTLSNGGVKTPLGNFTVEKDLTIQNGATLDASTFTLTVEEDFTNSGTFTANTSTITFGGDYSCSISGETTFNEVVINKTLSSTYVNLLNNITVNNIDLTSGNIDTRNDTITITGTRTNSGVIIGTIVRTHTFSDATEYHFEGPYNYIKFSSPSGIDSVIVNVDIGFVTDFDILQECITRKYTVSVPNGTYTNADFLFHYEQEEVNAFIEPDLVLYRYNSVTTSWDSIGADIRDDVNNYVQKNSIAEISGPWIATGERNIVRWDGSESTDWNTAGNWTTISGSDMSNRVPTSDDVAQVGYDTYTNEPALSSNANIGALRFGDSQEATLSINGNTLSITGDMRGIWTSNAHHTINTGSGTIDVGTNLSLSDDQANHYLTLNIGTGSVIVGNNVQFNGYGEINFTDAGLLKVSKDLNYNSGTFTPGTGTVEYTGSNPQEVAALTYNNLKFSKSNERASIDSTTIVTGDLTLTTGGQLVLNDTLAVYGDVTIGPGTEISTNNTYLSVQGNWANNGTFNPRDGTLCFNGTGAQTVSSTIVNTLSVNKSSGTLTSTGDIAVKSNLTISAGTWDMNTYEANRIAFGGSFTMADDGYLKVSGTKNFPKAFNTIELDTLSTVEYAGTVAQSIDSVTYGNIIFSNGGANEKTLTGNMKANGDFTINSGATVEPGSNTIELAGNFLNSGTYNPATSTFLINGDTKTFSGSTTVHNLYTNTGSYTFSSGPFTIEGDFFIDENAAIDFAAVTLTLEGDATNKGTLTSDGTVTFTGTQVQTVQLINSINSSGGVINFNGSVAPVFSSNSSPEFAVVNINNTAGISPSVPWTVYLAINIGAGAAFNAGPHTHTIYGNFVNNGTVTSDGTIKFTPAPAFSGGATITLDGTEFTSNGTVEFGGTVPLTINYSSPAFYDVDITNTDESGVTFSSGITIPNHLHISEGATLNGGASQTLTIGSNIDNNGTISGETSTVVFQGTPSRLQGSGTGNYHNITIDGGAELQLSKEINISGDFVNNNTFTPNGNGVCFNGSTASSIEGTTSPAVFDDMEINKSSNSVTLNVPATINSSLTMTSGRLNTSSSNLLTLIDEAISSSGNSSSYIMGPVKKIGNDAFVFPVGCNARFARIGISAPANATDAFTAEYADSGYVNTVDLTAPLNNVSLDEFWTLSRTTGTSNVQVTLYWESALSDITDLSDLSVARFDGSSWVDETQNGGTTGTTTTGSVTSQTITAFSPFTFGSKTADENPLPVEFYSFYARENQGAVNLDWITLSETENDYFEVQKSSDNRSFSTIGIVDGHGTTNEKTSYVFIDKSPFKGINYYRLKQVDMNGELNYSVIKAVTVMNPLTSAMQVYPNPVYLNSKVNIKLKYLESKEFTIKLFNTEGKLISKNKFQAEDLNGDILTVSPKSLGVTIPGQYIITIQDGQIRYNERIIIK